MSVIGVNRYFAFDRWSLYFPDILQKRAAPHSQSTLKNDPCSYGRTIVFLQMPHTIAFLALRGQLFSHGTMQSGFQNSLHFLLGHRK